MADKVDTCLSQWYDRARGYHTQLWSDWVGETGQALVEYRERQVKLLGLVKEARALLLDHQIERLAVKLGELERLISGYQT